MRADRVKPGMLVKDDEGVWQVVVGAARRKRPYPIDRGHAVSIVLDYATGVQEEVSQPGEDVEAVRLTEAQVAMLHRIADGEIEWAWRTVWANGPSLGYGSHWVAFTVTERLVSLGLVAGAPGASDRKARPATLSPSGRALLDLLSKERTR